MIWFIPLSVGLLGMVLALFAGMPSTTGFVLSCICAGISTIGLVYNNYDITEGP